MTLAVSSFDDSVDMLNDRVDFYAASTQVADVPSDENPPLTEREVSEKIAQFIQSLQREHFFHPSALELSDKILRIMAQESNEIINRALTKPAGYARQLFSIECWGEGCEYSTSLGKAVDAFINYAKSTPYLRNHQISPERKASAKGVFTFEPGQISRFSAKRKISLCKNGRVPWRDKNEDGYCNYEGPPLYVAVTYNPDKSKPYNYKFIYRGYLKDGKQWVKDYPLHLFVRNTSKEKSSMYIHTE